MKVMIGHHPSGSSDWYREVESGDRAVAAKVFDIVQASNETMNEPSENPLA